jgi:hypothetical protein
VALLGSSLNMAESELGVLSNQCLDRRIPDQKTLSKEIAAWEKGSRVLLRVIAATHGAGQSG